MKFIMLGAKINVIWSDRLIIILFRESLRKVLPNYQPNIQSCKDSTLIYPLYYM